MPLNGDSGASKHRPYENNTYIYDIFVCFPLFGWVPCSSQGLLAPFGRTHGLDWSTLVDLAADIPQIEQRS